MITVKIDEEECIGCGACAATHPDNFKMKERKAVVINDEVNDDSVISGCCVGAIRVSS